MGAVRPGKLAKAIVELDERLTMEMVRKALKAGVAPREIIEECRQGLAMVGDKYGRGEYFLSDLVMSAELFREAMAVVWPDAVSEQEADSGPAPIVIGTVRGDIHDLGKNITVWLLRSYGFRVTDLGVDVAPEDLVREVRQRQPRIVGMSALITAGLESMKATVDLLVAEGLRDRVTVIIGGLVDENVARYVGADAWMKDASEAVPLCRRLLGGAGETD
jgi:methylmalonyl-CoA mutase cobalamin-binding domain/chain